MKYFAHLLAATKYSMQGLLTAAKNELAFQKEIFVLIIIAPVSLMLDISWFERSLLIGSWLLVMIIELINSAIEAVVDRIGPEKNLLSGQAKDFGSAAVMLAIIISIALWFGVLTEQI